MDRHCLDFVVDFELFQTPHLSAASLESVGKGSGKNKVCGKERKQNANRHLNPPRYAFNLHFDDCHVARKCRGGEPDLFVQEMCRSLQRFCRSIIEGDAWRRGNRIHQARIGLNQSSAMRVPPPLKRRLKQPTPEAIQEAVLIIIERLFYRDQRVAFLRDRSRLLHWVVLWRATWRDERRFRRTFSRCRWFVI